MDTVIFYMLIIFVGGLICIIISATMAAKKDREIMLWAFFGLIFGIIAVLIIACLPPAKGTPKKDVTLSIELKELKELFDSGIITQSEYENKKKEILSRF